MRAIVQKKICLSLSGHSPVHQSPYKNATHLPRLMVTSQCERDMGKARHVPADILLHFASSSMPTRKSSSVTKARKPCRLQRLCTSLHSTRLHKLSVSEGAVVYCVRRCKALAPKNMYVCSEWYVVSRICRKSAAPSLDQPNPYCVTG